jgi:hypothetical protein
LEQETCFDKLNKPHVHIPPGGDSEVNKRRYILKKFKLLFFHSSLARKIYEIGADKNGAAEGPLNRSKGCLFCVRLKKSKKRG